MPRLSKLFIVTIAVRIARAVASFGVAPAPVLIPIPVRAHRDTQMTRRIR